MMVASGIAFMSENATLAAYGASIVIAILLAGYYYYDNKFKYFARLGLKNPKPLPVLGNLLSFFTENRAFEERKRLREFGKFYGIFQGANPRFVVADPELLRQICIKDFDKFPNHEASELLNNYQRRFLFFMQDDTWRQTRTLQSPTFTSGKIKRMYKLLNVCADDLIDCFQEQLTQANGKAMGQTNEKVIDLKEIYSLYTMDGIAACGFGLKLERKGSASIKSAASRNDFVAMAMRMFKFNVPRILVSFSLNQKFLSKLGWTATPNSDIEPLAEKVRHIIATRRKSSKKHDDYLQILLDANLDDKMELSEMDTKEHHHAGLTHDSLLADQKRMIDQLESKHEIVRQSATSLKKLSDEDILASAVFLFLVGLETTATLLSSCTYALAFHADIQERLHQEIAKIAELNSDKTSYVFDYDALTSCQYLDSVVSETLRALSPVLGLDRVAKEDYYVEKYNVTIPKNAKLILAYHAIMNDPDHWPEPDKFDPERFMPGRREKIVPGSYCPFGVGPRHCLGMRFSLTEAKLALAKVMMRYKFEPAPGTLYPPLSRLGLGLNPVKDPRVTLKTRN